MQRLYEAKALGDYMLLISSQVQADPQAWEWVRDFKGYKVMDNSLIELGKPAPLADVVAAAKFVQADAIVLPDFLYDSIGTTNAAQRALEELEDSPFPCDTVGVAQGTTAIEVLLCASCLWLAGCSVIALPRCLTDHDEIGSRRHLALRLRELLPMAKVILLGFSNNLADDMRSAQVEGVIGIDSAQPVWMGRAGQLLPDVPTTTRITPLTRPDSFWSQESLPTQVMINVGRVNQWLRST